MSEMNRKITTPSEGVVYRIPGRQYSIDFIKALAILMVIITHVAGITQEIKNVILWPYTVPQAVPLFLMASVYVFCFTEERAGGTVLSWFAKKRFCKRLFRFFVPWIVAIIVEILLLFALCGVKKIAFWAVVKILMQGGRGPGGYYVHIVFQLLLIFPFIRYFFDRSPCGTTVCLVLFQILWDSLCRKLAVPAELYNILIPRFLSNLALGFLFYKYRDKIRGTAIPMCALVTGGIYIMNIYYREFAPILTNKYGTRTMLGALFAFGLFYYLMELESVLEKRRKLFRPVFFVGKASFHVMLVQMVYFYYARTLEFEQIFKSLPIRMVVDIAISLFLGCVFFWGESKIRERLKELRGEKFGKRFNKF